MNSIIRTGAMTFVVALVCSSFGGPLDRAWIRGTTDRNALSYRVGDEVVFTLSPMDVEDGLPAGGYSLSWKRSGDDGVVAEGTEPFDGKTAFVYRTKIGAPGFVRLEAFVVDKAGKRYRQVYTGDTKTPEGKKAMNRFEKKAHFVFFDGGAGAETARLTPPPEPADFDAFWARQFARLESVPLRVERVELENKVDDYRIFAVRLSCAGPRPVTGYLIMPPDAGVRQYPVQLQLFGYDRNVGQHNPPPGAYAKNRIVLEINAYGMNLPAFGGTEADRKMLKGEIESNGHTYAFDPKQNADPETAFFNGMVLRIKRALQYLKTLPEWNGRDVKAEGGSQGGLQAIWAAACGEGVTTVGSYVTWCCDIAGNDKREGWYVKWTEALGYYDAVNWAKRIPKSCRVEIPRAGLGDYVCPPMGLAKLWNALSCPKRITWVQGSQHGSVPPADYPGRDTVWTENWLDETASYENPVIRTDWPDPTFWQGPDGMYYGVATGLKEIRRSTDLISWEPIGPVESASCRSNLNAFATTRWAPDFVKIGDEYRLYVTQFVTSDTNRLVCLSSKNPRGPFEFRSVVLENGRYGIRDLAIDAEVVVEGNDIWLFTGSVAGGIHRFALTADGTQIRPGEKPVHVAGLLPGDHDRKWIYSHPCYEGAYLYRRDGWWYLFVSSGSIAWDGYRLSCGRARTLTDDFVDSQGRSLAAGGGDVLLVTNDEFPGPGHNGEIFTDADGKTHMFFHSHWSAFPQDMIEFQRRCLNLQEIKWREDGWPYFETGSVVRRLPRPRMR